MTHRDLGRKCILDFLGNFFYYASKMSFKASNLNEWSLASDQVRGVTKKVMLPI